MNKKRCFPIDHTQLKAFATWDDMKTLCDEAAYGMASVYTACFCRARCQGLWQPVDGVHGCRLPAGLPDHRDQGI